MLQTPGEVPSPVTSRCYLKSSETFPGGASGKSRWGLKAS